MPPTKRAETHCCLHLDQLCRLGFVCYYVGNCNFFDSYAYACDRGGCACASVCVCVLSVHARVCDASLRGNRHRMNDCGESQPKTKQLNCDRLLIWYFNNNHFKANKQSMLSQGRYPTGNKITCLQLPAAFFILSSLSLIQTRGWSLQFSVAFITVISQFPF